MTGACSTSVPQALLPQDRDVALLLRNHAKAIKELRAAVPELGSALQSYDDVFLLRFVITAAAKGDPQSAVKALKRTLQWRNEKHAILQVP